MPNKVEKKLRENGIYKYFELEYEECMRFKRLKRTFEGICNLYVKKDKRHSSIYRVEFIDKKGQSLHPPYLYTSKEAFEEKFLIDPDEIIKEQEEIANSSKQNNEKQQKASRIPATPTVERKTKTPEIVKPKKEKKESFIKRIIKNMNKKMEAEREKARQNAIYVKLGIFTFCVTLLASYGYIEQEKKYTNNRLTFPTTENGKTPEERGFSRLDGTSNTYYPQNTQQTEGQNQTNTPTYANSGEPTTIQENPMSIPQTFNNTYYVSQSDTTETNTYKTIQEAVDKLQVGDRLVIKEGTYNEKIDLRNLQGSKEKPIVIIAEGKVIIDGTGKQGSLLSIKDSKYVIIKGITFEHLIADSSQGIFMGNNTSYIAVYNCVFKDIRCINDNTKDKGSNAIYVQGSSTIPIDHIYIVNSIAEDIGAGYSEVISFEGNITDFLIKAVTIISNGVESNIGICINGNQKTCRDPELDRPRNGIVEGCTVEGCKSPYGQTAYAYYTDGGKGIQFLNNTARNCEGGIEIGAEIKSSVHETENIIVKGNTVVNCDYGVQIGGFETKRGTVYNVEFDGNEITECGGKESAVLTFSQCDGVKILNSKLKPKTGALVVESQMTSDHTKNVTFEGITYEIDNPAQKCFIFHGKKFDRDSFIRYIESLQSKQASQEVR